MGLFNFLTETIGVDPGSHTMRIIKDGELVFNEQSQISIDRIKNVVSGIGSSVNTTSSDDIISPVNYVIADFQGFEMLLRGAIKKGINSRPFFGKSYVIYCSLPSNATEVEKRAYRDSAEHAGGKEIYMIHQNCCAAIGLNLLFEVKSFILIDFGYSKLEITVFANSLIISDGTIRLGTRKIFRLIRNYIFRNYKIDLGEKEIIEMLLSLKDQKIQDEIKIQHTVVKVSSIQTLLNNYFNLANDEILETIERAGNHPDIEKVLINGVFFTGGGSAIEFLRRQITLDNRIKHNLSQTPLMDNINGLKRVMADKEKFRNYIMT